MTKQKQDWNQTGLAWNPVAPGLSPGFMLVWCKLQRLENPPSLWPNQLRLRQPLSWALLWLFLVDVPSSWTWLLPESPCIFSITVGASCSVCRLRSLHLALPLAAQPLRAWGSPCDPVTPVLCIPTKAATVTKLPKAVAQGLDSRVSEKWILGK